MFPKASLGQSPSSIARHYSNFSRYMITRDSLWHCGKIMQSYHTTSLGAVQATLLRRGGENLNSVRGMEKEE